MSAGSSRSPGPLPLIGLMVAHLFSCAEEPVSFPSNAPPLGGRSSILTQAAPIARSTLRTLAGPGARDCGTASSQESAAEVYRCGSDAFAGSQPFFCGFGDAPEGSSLAPTPDGLVWAVPASYVGRGSSIALAERRGDPAPVLTDLLRLQPLHVSSGMTRPIPTAGPVTLPSGNDASGIIIVWATVGRDGRARDASLMKRLPSEEANRAALDLVGSSPFEPVRLFGMPVDVVTSITLSVDRREIRFGRTPRADSPGTILIEGQQFPIAGTGTASPAPDDADRPVRFPTKVFDLGPDIRPPVGVSRGEPRFAAGEVKCRGMVLLRSVIDETGRVVAVADLSKDPDAFTRAYANALYAWTFRPATRNGAPVAVHFTVVAYVKCS